MHRHLRRIAEPVQQVRRPAHGIADMEQPPDELSGVDVCIEGWDIRGRWFGVVVGATPRLGEMRRGEVIAWRVVADQLAPRERRGPR